MTSRSFRPVAPPAGAEEAVVKSIDFRNQSEHFDNNCRSSADAPAAIRAPSDNGFCTSASRRIQRCHRAWRQRQLSDNYVTIFEQLYALRASSSRLDRLLDEKANDACTSSTFDRLVDEQVAKMSSRIDSRMDRSRLQLCLDSVF